MKTDQTMSRAYAFLCVAVGATLWGTLGIFFRVLADYGFGRGEVVFLRTGIALVGLFLLLLLSDRNKFRIRLRDLWMFLANGILSLFFLNFFYYTAVDLTSVSVAAVLLYTAPAFVVVMSALFFGERLTGIKAVALCLTLPGCAIVSGVLGASGGYPAAGILSGLGAGLAYALYTIFSRLALRRYDSLTITFYTFLIAALASGFLSSPRHMAVALQSPGAWAAAIGLGILTGLLPYLLYTKGLSGIGNGEASITATLEPAVAMLLGLLILREQMTWERLLGILMILTAVLIIGYSNRMQEKKKAEARVTK